MRVESQAEGVTCVTQLSTLSSQLNPWPLEFGLHEHLLCFRQACRLTTPSSERKVWSPFPQRDEATTTLECADLSALWQATCRRRCGKASGETGRSPVFLAGDSRPTVSPLTPSLSPLRGEGVAMHSAHNGSTFSRARYVCAIERTRRPSAENASSWFGRPSRSVP